MVQKYFNNKYLFKRHKYASPKTSYIKYFGPSSPNMRGLYMLLTYPYTKVKKMVYPKNTWMQRCSGTDWQGGIKDFLNWGWGSQKKGDKCPLQTMYMQ